MNKTIMMVAAIGLGATSMTVGLESAEARQRASRCVVETQETGAYRGPCLFEAGRGGSFTVEPPAGRRLIADVVSVRLDVTGTGVADVRGLTTSVVNSRWGRAVRSRRDRACWVGSAFRVCAY